MSEKDAGSRRPKADPLRKCVSSAMHLMPLYLNLYAYAAASTTGGLPPDRLIECGACTYICPAATAGPTIQAAKRRLADEKKRQQRIGAL
jgi:ferredoxin